MISVITDSSPAFPPGEIRAKKERESRMQTRKKERKKERKIEQVRFSLHLSRSRASYLPQLLEFQTKMQNPRVSQP